MRVGTDDLIFWAICALDELAEAAAEGPIAPNYAVKTLLAFLHAHSDGESECYAAFWRALQAEHAGAWSDGDRRYMRSSAARSAFEAITRGLGIDWDADLIDRLHRARRGPPQHPSKSWTEAVEAARRRRQERPGISKS